MAKTISIRLDDRTYSLFRRLAEEENRTLSNFIETAALRSIQESECIDEFEMAEIRNNRTLNQSLKRGLADAKHKRVISSDRYRIFGTREYLDRFSRFSTSDQTFLHNKTRNYLYPQLQKEPHFGLNIKKLVNYDPETWRCRPGRFRLFYSLVRRG